jgi:predicted amidohydrolase YtcJ
LLIKRAEVWGLGPADLRIAENGIAEIGELAVRPGENVLDARGGALLPGLHDHHIHLAGLAVRASSVACGPPDVTSRDELANALAQAGAGWIRGIGYHESVMGLPGARELDALVSDRPLRIQHRSGRMWLLNSRALETLLARAEPPPGLERDGQGFTGRLFDEDRWLRETLASAPPDFNAISRELAGFGVTGVTDMSPANDPAMARHFAAQMESGALTQHCVLAGTLSLADAEPGRWELGPGKLHLHEAALPDFDEATAFIAAAHCQHRSVAIHCVSEVELVFALAALEAAGSEPGDRIEHASVASAELVERIATLGLRVCVQPHFIAERGDRYLADVEPRHIPDLYRLRTLMDAGIALAGGSDAPFGGSDPWAAMRAAVTRTTSGGARIGGEEALAPEEALELYLAAPGDLSCRRTIAVGEAADFCLLDRPWRAARERLRADDVRAAIVSGRLVHDRIDQAPGKGMAGA